VKQWRERVEEGRREGVDWGSGREWGIAGRREEGRKWERGGGKGIRGEID